MSVSKPVLYTTLILLGYSDRNNVSFPGDKLLTVSRTVLVTGKKLSPVREMLSVET
jgi:hypothetical protein